MIDNNVNPSRNSIDGRLILLVAVGVMFIASLVGMFLSLPYKKAPIEVVNTQQAIQVFNQRYKLKIGLSQQPQIWPKSYIYANTGDGTINLVTPDTTYNFYYDKLGEGKTLKQLKLPQNDSIFSHLYREYCLNKIQAPINPKYIEEMEQPTLPTIVDKKKYAVESNKNITYLYNYLVGNTNERAEDRVVVYALKKNEWPQKLTSEYFPRFTIDTLKFIQLLNREEPGVAENLLNWLEKENVVIKRPYIFGFANYRDDLLTIDNLKYNTDPSNQNNAQDFGIRLITDNLRQYFNQRLHHPHFIYDTDHNVILNWEDLETKYQWIYFDEQELSQMPLSKKETFPWWALLIGACAILLLMAIILALLIKIQPYQPILTASGSETLEQKKQRESAMINKAIQEYKQSKEYKALENRIAADAVNNFKNSEEYRNIILALINQGLQEYKQSKEYKALENRIAADAVNNFKNSEEYRNLILVVKNTNFKIQNAIDEFKKTDEYVKLLKSSQVYNIEKFKIEEYNRLIDSKEEKDVLNWLKQLRKKYSSLPEITSKQSIIDTALKNKDNNPLTSDKFLTLLLAQLQDVMGDGNYKNVLDWIETTRANAGEYKKIKPFYDETKSILESYHEVLKNTASDKLNIMDRIAVLSYSLTKLAVPLCNAWKKPLPFEPSIKQIVEAIETDIVLSLAARNFVNELANNSTNADGFDNSLSASGTIGKAVAQFNQKASDIAIAIDPNNQRIQQLRQALVFIKSNQLYVEKMWKNFVSEFVDSVHDNQDKAWFMQHIMHIALYSIDYIQSAKHPEQKTKNFANLQYLLDDFNTTELSAVKFIHNDAELSNVLSNRIYKWASEEQINHLNVIIENYLINY